MLSTSFLSVDPNLTSCEFTCAIIAAVYVPLEANAELVMKELGASLSKLLTDHPDGAVVIAGRDGQYGLRTTS